MSLVSRDAPGLITITVGAAEVLVCPFTRESEFNEYCDTKCKSISCMAWVRVVDTTVNNSGICPEGYVELSDSEFDTIYGGRLKEPKIHYFRKDLKDRDEKGYCLRLQGCIK